MSQTKNPTGEHPPAQSSGFSRRGFIHGAGITGAVAPGLLQDAALAQSPAGAAGPGAVPITLNINGKAVKVSVEPRMTLLDTLRNELELTGAKRVCDRGTCGACTVLLDGKAVYACSLLAIDVQGRRITTIEGFALDGGRPHPIVQAFVEHDAQQCGYCTPGFVVAAKGFLDATPRPTMDQVKDGLGGNLCRCGTYSGVRKAVLDAAGKMKGGSRA